MASSKRSSTVPLESVGDSVVKDNRRGDAAMLAGRPQFAFHFPAYRSRSPMPGTTAFNCDVSVQDAYLREIPRAIAGVVSRRLRPAPL